MTVNKVGVRKCKKWDKIKLRAYIVSENIALIKHTCAAWLLHRKNLYCSVNRQFPGIKKHSSKFTRSSCNWYLKYLFVPELSLVHQRKLDFFWYSPAAFFHNLTSHHHHFPIHVRIKCHDICFHLKSCRRNPSGNWVILILSWQNPCIRIFSAISHSYLHFSRAIDVISYL